MVKEKRRRRLVISANTTWNLANFRVGLIRALIAEGYQVHALASDEPDSTVILADLGVKFHNIKIDSSSTSILHSGMLLFAYYWHIRRIKPCAFLGFTVKPNLFGSLACRFSRVPVIVNVAGLGVAFSNDGFLRRVAIFLYRLCLSAAHVVFFQNNHDRQLFQSHGVLKNQHTIVLPGSGVDIETFTFCPMPERYKVRFILVARLIWEKGIAEFIEAAKLIIREGHNVEFVVAGFLDVDNPAAVPATYIHQAHEEGIIKYIGPLSDVRGELIASHCVVLPTYYKEGTPRILLESGALGRPAITTDTPGCNDVVEHGDTGFLCKPRDVLGLASQMRNFIELNPLQRQAMANAASERVRLKYDEQIVVREYIDVIRQLDGST